LIREVAGSYFDPGADYLAWDFRHSSQFLEVDARIVPWNQSWISFDFI
jgi:hypothetical protein